MGNVFKDVNRHTACSLSGQPVEVPPASLTSYFKYQAPAVLKWGEHVDMMLNMWQ